MDAHVHPAGVGLILVHCQSTSGSTQPGERPTTARSGDVSSTRQHSIMGHVVIEEENLHLTGKRERDNARNNVRCT